ncbi:cold-shock protein [Pontibacillus halophilus JSM 076056 = DSM 19796]|uniref:Cold-shock protein n=1 Tax=Pontibacillus halophilus JSM 076056 = DSM 19796 TaxID=1385510 RepID=A0A0A5I841_9BACI|nr:cold-shock protein [Pontibacillus halophilus]KGX91987.1 cold-shock protein [Pontibacillus halophilus JSM 076056 = DSM 19796]
MAFGKKNTEEVKREDLKIWECVSEDCNAWMRDNFKTQEQPTCPICGSDMSTSVKELQVVENNSMYAK